MRGDETTATLYNLVTALQRRKTSYLAQAIALDEELYEQSLQGPQRPPKKAPDLVEVGLSESLLMGIHEQLQQLNHWSAVNTATAFGQQKPPKPKVKSLPRPETARNAVERRLAREAFQHFEDVIVFVPQEQFEQTIARARAEQEGGGPWPATPPEPPPSTSSPA